jgi:phosphohistidine phosphatase
MVMSDNASPGPVRLLRDSLQQRFLLFEERRERLLAEYSAENLHDFRTSTRRLLAAIVLLGLPPRARRLQRCRREMRRVFRRTGPLRDAEVEGGLAGEHAPASPLVAEFSATLALKAEGLRPAVLAEVREMDWGRARWQLERACRRLNRHGMAVGPSLLFQAAARSLDEARSGVLESLRAADPRRSETLHRLRIAVKKLRYLMEALAPLAPQEFDAVLSQAVRLQGLLGTIHDEDVLLADMRQFAAQKKGAAARGWPGVRAAIGRQRAIHVAELAALCDQLGNPVRQIALPLPPQPQETTMINLYIVRHGLAGDAMKLNMADDSQRTLTKKGVKLARRVAREMRKQGMMLDLIFTSPYVRAAATAEILAGEYGLAADRVVTCPGLVPGTSFPRLVNEINQHLGQHRNVAVVGHEPQLSQLVSLLISGSPHGNVVLKKNGVCHLTLEELLPGKCASLEALLTPELLV